MSKNESKSTIRSQLAMESYILIAATASTLVFIWSVARLAKLEVGSSFRGSPNNYAAIVAVILLIFAIAKCKSRWERSLVTICFTILASSYLIYFFGLN